MRGIFRSCSGWRARQISGAMPWRVLKKWESRQAEAKPVFRAIRPSGSVVVRRSFSTAANLLGVKFLDHIILGAGDAFLSLAEFADE